MPFDGKTYTYHLNRLAGTLDANDVPQLEARAAANLWAGTNGLALAGALNAKYASLNAGVSFDYDVKGALNALAGTSGLGENLAASLIVS